MGIIHIIDMAERVGLWDSLLVRKPGCAGVVVKNYAYSGKLLLLLLYMFISPTIKAESLSPLRFVLQCYTYVSNNK